MQGGRPPQLDTSQSDRMATVLRVLAVGLLGLLLVWPSFVEGLAKDGPQYLATWQVTVLLGLVFALGRRERRPFVFTPARLAAVAFWLAYALSAATVAVVPRDAIQEVIKNTVFLGAFLAVSEVVHSSESRRDGLPAGSTSPVSVTRLLGGPWGVAGFLWAGVGVFALASLAGAVGLLPAPFEIVKGGRLFTYIAYPNTAGALLAAAFVLGLGLGRAPRAASALRAVAMDIGQWALLTAFILTVSRGAVLAAGVALALTFFLWPAGRRAALLREFALTGIAAAVTAPLLSQAFDRPGPGAAFIVAGMGLAVGAGWLRRRFGKLAPRRQVVVAAAAAVTGLVLVAGLLLATDIPGTLLHRLTSFSLSELSAWQRLAWIGDAFQVVKDHPVLGVGGGGWASIYFSYQSFGYYSKQVHSDYLETWVEAGTLGFAALVALLGLSAHALWRRLRATPPFDAPTRAPLAGLGGAAATIAVHAAIDFDLAYGAVGIFLWAVLGVVDGLAVTEAAPPLPAPRQSRKERRRRHHRAPLPPVPGTWWRRAFVATAVILSLLSAGLFAAARLSAAGTRLIRQSNLDDARDALVASCRLDPWSSFYRVKLTEFMVLAFTITEDTDYLLEAYRQIKASVGLDPFNPSRHAEFSEYAFMFGRFEEAVQAQERALELHPFEATRYVSLAQAYVRAAQQYLSQGDTEKARAYLELAVAVPDRQAAQAAKVPEYAAWTNPLPPRTAPLDLQVGAAQALLGNWDEALGLLEEARAAPLSKTARETETSASQRKAWAELWLALVHERLGHDKVAAGHLERAAEVIPEAYRIRSQLAPLLGGAGEP